MNGVVAPRDDTDTQIYTESQLREIYGVVKDETDWKTTARNIIRRKCTCSAERAKTITFGLIPILQWMPKYKPKKYLMGDIAAGITVGIVHLPQGMAYGLLASLPPIFGLYVSFFPVLMYVIFGTSKHVSVGTFAVISLMIAQVIGKHVQPCVDVGSSTASAVQLTTTLSTHATETVHTTTLSAYQQCEEANSQRKIQIAVALAMANGIVLIAMSLFRLGFITNYLSEHLVSGFTCGAAFHVLTSQVPKLLGIAVERQSGPLALIRTYIELFKNIATISWATVIVSLCCILFLVAGKIINTRFHDRLPVPIPWELLVVVFSTLASYFGHLHKNYGLQVVGVIPTGIKTTVPHANDLGAVILESIPIAIVSFAIEISLCQMFATKHSYEIDSNQELLALGIGNVFGSFFSCFPLAASLSRSVIWEEVGAHTQVTGIVSSILILIILLWIGPLFESLPQATLAAIIVVNLKGMLMQFERVKPLWKVSKLDAVTWVVTWLAVILLGVELGLAVGVGFEIFTVVWKTQIITGYAITEVGETGNFRRQSEFRKRHKKSSNVIMFHFPGPLYFANKERFKVQINRLLGFDPVMRAGALKHDEDEGESLGLKGVASYAATDDHRLVLGDRRNDADSNSSDSEADSAIAPTMTPMARRGSRSSREGSNLSFPVMPQSPVRDVTLSHGIDTESGKMSYLLLDMSACSFVDNDGAKMICNLHAALQKVGVSLLLASCNGAVRGALIPVCVDRRPPFFVSIKRALEFARHETSVELDEFGNVLVETSETRL